MIYVGIDMQVERKLGGGLIITLIVVTLVILAYSVITSSLSSLLELYSMDTPVSLLVITLGWIISALRLKLLFESSMKGITLPLIDSLAIRLIGGLTANITPSSIGGEPGRAYYLSRRTGVDTVKSYALVIYEVYYDVLAVNIIGAFLSVKYLPLSTPVLLVSLFMSFSWLSISLKIVRAGRNMPSGPDAA
ncbi:MAG: flippase-like domain-containing protein, partial [Desulfurococcus sp.]